MDNNELDSITEGFYNELSFIGKIKFLLIGLFVAIFSRK